MESLKAGVWRRQNEEMRLRKVCGLVGVGAVPCLVCDQYTPGLNDAKAAGLYESRSIAPVLTGNERVPFFLRWAASVPPLFPRPIFRQVLITLYVVVWCGASCRRPEKPIRARISRRQTGVLVLGNHATTPCLLVRPP